MPRLVRSVFVRDPVRHRDVLLHAGEEPAAEYAVLVTNPACWENGEVPTAAAPFDSGAAAETKAAAKDDDKAAPAAKKPAARKPAATKPASGRAAADEGSSGS